MMFRTVFKSSEPALATPALPIESDNKLAQIEQILVRLHSSYYATRPLHSQSVGDVIEQIKSDFPTYPLW